MLFFSQSVLANDYNELLSEEYNNFLLEADDKKMSQMSVGSQYFKPIVVVQDKLERRFGYVVGDILNRSIFILHHESDKLETKSLPLVGNDVRGIELRAINYEDKCGIADLSAIKEKISDSVIGKIKDVDLKKSCLLKVNYKYQVFSSKVVAKPAALPSEYFKFTNKGGGLQMLRSDNIKFRISPLAVYGNVDLIEEIGNDATLPNIEIDYYVKQQSIGLIIFSVSFFLLVVNYIYGFYIKMQSPFYKILNKLNRQIYKNELNLILDIRFVFNEYFSRNIFEDEVRDNKLFNNLKDTKFFEDIQWFYNMSAEFLFQKDKNTYVSEIFDTKKKDYTNFLKSLIKNRHLLSKLRVEK